MVLVAGGRGHDLDRAGGRRDGCAAELRVRRKPGDLVEAAEGDLRAA